MKLTFPVYVISDPNNHESWLKSKLNENEYFFVFTSSELAESHLAAGRGLSLLVLEVDENRFTKVLEKEANQEWGISGIALDCRTPGEIRVSIKSVLSSLN